MSKGMSDHQKKVARVLEGNERVYFHPFEDKIAVWHGGPQVQIVNPKTWKEIDVFNVKVANRGLSEIEDAVWVSLVKRGFDRNGRSQDDTRVVKH